MFGQLLVQKQVQEALSSRQTFVFLSFFAACLLMYTLRSQYGGTFTNRHTGPVKVLLNTYMRSGSTFLGKVLGWRNDTFYIYEPLWKNYTWLYLSDKSHICSMVEPSCKTIDVFPHPALQYLQDVYACNISQHHANIVNIHTGSLAGPGWGVFRNCMKVTKTKNSKIACLRKEVFFCNTTRNIVTKVLRLSLESARPLLSMIPDLKIIHLLRDPRGVMNSRAVTTSWYKQRLRTAAKFENGVKVLCSRMQHDIDVGKQLMNEFPDRVKIVQYEDFGDPVDRAEKLYRFLGMTDTKQNVNQFVKTINHSKSKKSSFHPFSYRKTFPWKYMKIVNRHCTTVYKELGLVKFNNEAELKNETISAIKSVLPFTLT